MRVCLCCVRLECVRVTPGSGVPMALVGQWGVRPRAGVTIKAGEPLGVYEGLVFQRGSCPPCVPVDSDFHANLWLGPDSSDHLKVCLPTISLPLIVCDAIGGNSVCQIIAPDPPYGNGMMERINDFRDDVKQPGSGTVNDRKKLNCEWVTVLADFQPFEIVVATTDIVAPAWLLLDYGEGYWQYRL